ncbi:nucleotidyl transferase AbiEii/AbiGii toxin family protein [Promicromonospora sukumoe]|uniref:nucleotidyl transferase AbiEii/AbiGii toxin family protein n=1 Tax=Promicromonospora sukumoe TaxID=88382 RepID=UPI003669D853
MYDGDLEIHITVSSWEADRLDTFAHSRGLKVSRIELDHGRTPVQPMLTFTLRGSLDDALARVARVRAELMGARIQPVRVKVEAAPWNPDVPVTDDEAKPGLHFEHHVKLRLPGDDLGRLIEASRLARRHDARTSRNARRRRDDGSTERFVTQRCFDVGRTTSRARLDALLKDLDSHDFEVLEVEEEYVVLDDNIRLDSGWMDHAEPIGGIPLWTSEEHVRRLAVGDARSDFPATFHLPDPAEGVTQHPVFDPALKQFPNAFRTAPPTFDDARRADAWHAARERALAHVLRVIARSPWADHLVARGSVTLPVWLGDDARRPGDIDFVVTPSSLRADSTEARALLDGIVAALAADPGPGLRAADATREGIWTYERAEGRRIVVPFDVVQDVVPGALPSGVVQIDLVFDEPLPVEPDRAVLPPSDAELFVAPPGLQLAWKVQWLVTDMYPQGKDLYDAVLLSRHAELPWQILVDLLAPEVQQPSGAVVLTASDILAIEPDWDAFAVDHPHIRGDRREWVEELALAVHRSERAARETGEPWSGRP